MLIKNTAVTIVHGDITDLHVDAIVNAADNQLTMKAGLSGIISKKGGEDIEAEAIGKGPINVGEALRTQAGQLKARHVIHTVTMGEDGLTDETKIRQACASALQCAGEAGIASLALPALGCGEGGFPVVGAAKIMAQEVLKYIRAHETALKEIIFCLYDEETFHAFNLTVSGYITHIQDTLGDGPYVTVDAIIELKEGIILIERSNPPYGLALPGGFVDNGESLEVAVRREAKEETNMELINLRQFHTYSEPTRDPRFHTVSTVFIAEGKGTPQYGDDAKGLKVIPYADILTFDYAFDHKKVIQDYLVRVSAD